MFTNWNMDILIDIHYIFHENWICYFLLKHFTVKNHKLISQKRFILDIERVMNVHLFYWKLNTSHFLKNTFNLGVQLCLRIPLSFPNNNSNYFAFVKFLNLHSSFSSTLERGQFIFLMLLLKNSRPICVFFYSFFKPWCYLRTPWLSFMLWPRKVNSWNC